MDCFQNKVEWVEDVIVETNMPATIKEEPDDDAPASPGSNQMSVDEEEVKIKEELVDYQIWGNEDGARGVLDTEPIQGVLPLTTIKEEPDDEDANGDRLSVTPNDVTAVNTEIGLEANGEAAEYDSKTKVRANDDIKPQLLTSLVSTHSCTLCSYRSWTRSKLMVHIKEHTQKGPEVPAAPRDEMMRNHEKCSEFNNVKNGTTESVCITTVRAGDDVKPWLPDSLISAYSCSLCCYRSKTKSKLKGHFKKHTRRKPRLSFELSEKMKGLSGKFQVQLSVEANKEAAEGVSKTTVKAEDDLKPRLPDNPISRYSCSLCSFSARTRTQMKIHIKKHAQNKSGKKPHACESCDYSCTSRADLIKHMRTHTGEKPFECNLCDYKSAYSGSLFQHMRTHSGVKPYTCDLCEYRSTSSSGLRRHKKTHTGEKPYACTLCNYRCKHEHNLATHSMLHTGEKPLSCALCNYRCIQSGDMKKHMATHTGEKPYACGLCDYKYAYRASLVMHMRTHTGEKPYHCDLCQYRCRGKAGLVRHKKIHSGERSYVCDFCDYTCVLKQYLKVHYSKMHKREVSAKKKKVAT